MTLILELPPAAEEALADEARRRGTTPAQLATQTLVQTFPGAGTQRTLHEQNAALIALVNSFEEGDAEAQQREYAELVRILEEDRPGQRRLFSIGFNL